MDEGEVIVRRDGQVVYITINREEALNALNGSILEKLDVVFHDLEDDRDVAVAVISGAGRKAFVAGADVREIKEAGTERTIFITRGQQVLSRIRTSPKVVIAAINGYALGGGCELALACDLRIASEKAKIGMPEVSIGVMAGYGGTQLLPRLIGVGKAKYMIFSGVMVNAQEALDLGLVEKVYPEELLMKEVGELARKIASSGPIALRCSKRSIDEGMSLSVDGGLQLELVEYDKVAHSQDAEEGLSAFLEKRKPIFTGT